MTMKRTIGVLGGLAFAVALLVASQAQDVRRTVDQIIATTCTSQAVTAIAASGSATCASITNAFLTAGSFTSITGTGTLTAGATGSGFTIDLSNSTISSSAWTSYSPTITSSTGTLTTVSGTCYYIKLAKTMPIACSVTVTNAGTGGGSLNVTFPASTTAAAHAMVIPAISTGTLVGGQALVASGDTKFQAVKYDGTSIFGNGSVIAFNGVIEIQ